ncbi:site-specificintegrase [Pseudoalteromonas phage KB12-38]|nr:site-specificintegrase [Pseudoalteromonas phage KB12-38]
MGTKRGAKLPTGVRIRKHSGGKETIYIHFTYKGVKCPEPLSNRIADKSNIQYADRLRGEILNKIENGTFNYADYFPNSKKLKVFGAEKSNATMQYYLDLALENCERRGLKEGTLSIYRSRYKQLGGLIGHLQPEILDVRYLSNFYIEQHDKGVKRDTLRGFTATLRAAFYEVVMSGRLPSNPMDSLDIARLIPIKASDQEAQAHPFSNTELTRMWELNYESEHVLLFKFWVQTGVRSGELCALTWNDLDFEKRTLKIERTYVTPVKVINAPKTRASKRTIPLNDEAMVLAKEQYEKEKNLDPDLVAGDRLIFKNPLSKIDYYTVHYLNRFFKEFCGVADIPYRPSYQLRHTHATMRISRGDNLWRIAKDLGHTSPQMLFRHYGDYIEDYEKA